MDRKRQFVAVTASVFAAGALLLSHFAPAAEWTAEAKAELARLQGKWVVDYTERAGQREPRPDEPAVVEVQEDKLLLGGRDVGLRIALLETTVQPRLIDIVQVENKQRIEGVYELQEQQWRICINGDAANAAERPPGFDTTVSSRYVLVVLTREK
jgi:uncharacterized protein (TIGR03067 family)